MQLVAPAGEVVPAGHAEQATAPTPAANVPAGHGAHELEPSLSANVPGAHCVHELAPLDENEPLAHAEQVEASAVFENVPAEQATQLPLTRLVPPSHWVTQAIAPVAPRVDLPSGHGVQLPAPAVAENVSTGHGEQVAAPAAANFPGGQAMQPCALGA